MRPPTSFIGRGDFNGRLVTVVYYETRTFFMWRRYSMYAQIFWMGADISWAQIFHGRRYFMGADISGARIFHGREYFDVSEYFMCKLLF